ncbi:hypothetical protein NMG60_11017244 [Bertholletia excelsa]
MFASTLAILIAIAYIGRCTLLVERALMLEFKICHFQSFFEDFLQLKASIDTSPIKMSSIVGQPSERKFDGVDSE